MKILKSFREFTEEEEQTKALYFTFGRFQPPTIGHEKLFKFLAKEAKNNNADYKIYASQKYDPKDKEQRYPLEYKEKIKFLRLMFPSFGRNIIEDKNIIQVGHVAEKAEKDGYTKLIMVTGSDHGRRFEWLRKHNDFSDGIHFLTIPRDESDNVEGMKATKLRNAAREGDFAEFKKGMPSGFTKSQDLFNAVRKGLGEEEITDFTKDINLKPAPVREQYIQGKIFNIEDDVIYSKDMLQYKITERYTNYVSIENNLVKKKAFITDLYAI